MFLLGGLAVPPHCLPVVLGTAIALVVDPEPKLGNSVSPLCGFEKPRYVSQQHLCSAVPDGIQLREWRHLIAPIGEVRVVANRLVELPQVRTISAKRVAELIRHVLGVVFELASSPFNEEAGQSRAEDEHFWTEQRISLGRLGGTVVTSGAALDFVLP